MTNPVFVNVGDTQEEDVNNDDHNVHGELEVQPQSSHVVLDVGQLSSSHTNDPLPLPSATESSHVVLDVEQLSSSVMNDPSPLAQALSSSVRNDPSSSAQVISSSVKNDPSPSSTLFVRRRFQYLLLERSFRRRLRIWVVLELLIHKMMTQSGSEKAVIFLRVLQKMVLPLPRMTTSLSEEGATMESQIQGNQEIQQTQEIEKVNEEETQDFKEKDQEIEEVKEEETQDHIEKDQDIQAVEEKDQPFKKMSEWWGNTRNIMAMVAILFITLSRTSSFAPPHGVLEDKVVAIIFIIAVHLSLMTSMDVLFFLFSITAISPNIEKRLLQVSNLGLWSSLLGLTLAYISNLWMLGIHEILKIILTITTTSGFLLMFSFFYSRKVRSASRGYRILHETNSDVPYMLTEIFNAQETVQS